jgi:hypothetical protein
MEEPLPDDWDTRPGDYAWNFEFSHSDGKASPFDRIRKVRLKLDTKNIWGNQTEIYECEV